MTNLLTLGISPCPNDTFIFDAMIHGKIETEGLGFDVVMTDVEELNQKAFQNELDITKLSFHAFAYVIDDYVLLDAGSALGNNCGPLLISNINHSAKGGYASGGQPSTINHLKIAIPGKYTTANFLFSLAYPNAQDKVEILFSEIEEAVLSGEADAGVIIHENRFTYHEKGLKKIIDLGEYWENLTKCPIPLGGIVVKQDLSCGILTQVSSCELHKKINRVIRRSVEFAMANPNSSADFVKSNAQEMDEEVIKQHIALYVNDYTLELGEKGRKAIYTLFEKGAASGIIPEVNTNILLQKSLTIND